MGWLNMSFSQPLLLHAHSFDGSNTPFGLVVEQSITLGVEIDSMQSIVDSHEMDEIRCRCDKAYWFDPNSTALASRSVNVNDIAQQCIPVKVTQVAVHRYDDSVMVRFYGKSVDGNDAFCTDYIPFSCKNDEFIFKTAETKRCLGD
jgi:hypothetical protein